MRSGDILNRTTEYYRANAEQFYRGAVGLDTSLLRDKFLDLLPRNAHILDAGCGSGRDTKAFLAKDYTVTAFDASPVLATKAEELCVQPVLTQDNGRGFFYDNTIS